MFELITHDYSTSIRQMLNNFVKKHSENGNDFTFLLNLIGEDCWIHDKF